VLGAGFSYGFAHSAIRKGPPSGHFLVGKGETRYGTCLGGVLMYKKGGNITIGEKRVVIAAC